jgi:hypothetical protein
VAPNLALSLRQPTRIRIKIIRAAANAKPHPIGQLTTAPGALATWILIHSAR